jgi:flagella synthesis protein FlgN
MPAVSPLSTLNQEFSLISSLVELMQTEQQHLIGADLDGITAATEQKSLFVAQMAALAKQRHQCLADLGLAPQEAGMQAWIEQHGDAAAIDLWQQMLARTREAKELNRVNGMLINRQMSHTQTLLTAMRTPTASAATTVYGPNGQTTGLNPSRRYVLG